MIKSTKELIELLKNDDLDVSDLEFDVETQNYTFKVTDKEGNSKLETATKNQVNNAIKHIEDEIG